MRLYLSNLNLKTMETENRNNRPTHNLNQADDANRQAPSKNQTEVDAQRGDNDDFTTNGLDEGNTIGNDDNPADARESGTK